MKAIRIVAAILFVILLATYCSQKAPRREQDKLIKRANSALEARGILGADLRVVEGKREKAVCGSGGGRRFFFRGHPDRTVNALIVQGDRPSQEFDALFKAWCE